MNDKPFAAASERNSGPILGVLRRELAAANDVLEIGSGTGQHAVTFGRALGHLRWQTSDLEDRHPGIRAWLADDGPDNVLAPLALDMRDAVAPDGKVDAVYSANTAHIMSFDAVRGMFVFVSDVLRDDGVFCLYGPMRRGGDFGTDSNAAFDASLRQRDPVMGIRDLEQLDALATAGGMRRQRLYAMPANNHLVVWRRHREGRGDDNA